MGRYGTVDEIATVELISDEWVLITKIHHSPVVKLIHRYFSSVWSISHRRIQRGGVCMGARGPFLCKTGAWVWYLGSVQAELVASCRESFKRVWKWWLPQTRSWSTKSNTSGVSGKLWKARVYDGKARCALLAIRNEARSPEIYRGSRASCLNVAMTGSTVLFHFKPSLHDVL